MHALPRLVSRDRLIIQPASQITEHHDWWPLAERLAARVGEPLLAAGVRRPSRQRGRSRLVASDRGQPPTTSWPSIWGAERPSVAAAAVA